MQDERQNQQVIELLAKALDEPLTPAEQARVESALQDSIVLSVAAEALYEFDSLLKRLGMEIPDEGFPLRVLARIEAYERLRSREQWGLTLGLILLGTLTAAVWVGWNFDALLSSLAQWFVIVLVLIPLSLSAAVIVLQTIGQGPLVLYALFVLALTWILTRTSGAASPIPPDADVEQ